MSKGPYEKLPDVNCQYGAPMGRDNVLLEGNTLLVIVHLHLRVVHLDDGGYDNGGAYWGTRGKGHTLYHAVGKEVSVFADIFHTSPTARRRGARDQVEALLLQCNAHVIWIPNKQGEV